MLYIFCGSGLSDDSIHSAIMFGNPFSNTRIVYDSWNMSRVIPLGFPLAREAPEPARVVVTAITIFALPANRSRSCSTASKTNVDEDIKKKPQSVKCYQRVAGPIGSSPSSFFPTSIPILVFQPQFQAPI